jgi:hypothetical protein
VGVQGLTPPLCWVVVKRLMHTLHLSFLTGILAQCDWLAAALGTLSKCFFLIFFQSQWSALAGLGLCLLMPGLDPLGLWESPEGGLWLHGHNTLPLH